MMNIRGKILFIILVVVLLVTMLTGCGKKESTIKVGAKEFSEQLLLGQMTLLALEDAGYKVEDKTGIAGSDKVRSGLINKEVDIYWEYTGTAWLSLLQHDQPLTDSQDCYDQVKATDQNNGIEWLNYAPFNNTYTIMMRKEKADELGIKTISDLGTYLATHSDQLLFAVDHEFTARADGLSGLEGTYGFTMNGDKLLVMDNGIIYKSLKEGRADIGMGFSTDGRIKAFGLINLEDDLRFFPAYNPAPNLRTEFAEKNPKIVEILNHISTKLDIETMRRLNYLVDIEEKTPKEVAKEWLQAEGIIKR